MLTNFKPTSMNSPAQKSPASEHSEPSALERMLMELEGNQLVVILVPQKRHTNEGGMIRVAVSKNATWYRRFCSAHLSGRKRRNSAPDTRIKRFHTIAALQAMIAGVRSTYYHDQLKAIAAKF
jgi:hypothetical protein